MSRPILLLLSAVAGVAICAAIVLAFVTVPARVGGPTGAWSETERTEFIRSCVDSCRKSPGVTPDRFPLCDDSCKCAADEGEKLLPARELTQIYTAYQNGTASPEQREKLKTLQDASLVCARKFR